MGVIDSLFRSARSGSGEPAYTPSMRAERLVASGRIALASASLAAVWLDPSAPSRYAAVAYGLMSVYAAYALILGLTTWRHPARSTTRRLLTHVVDLSIFTAVIYLTEGATSPFFLYFIFSLLSATLRFRLRGTFWTAVASLIIFIGMGVWASAVLNDPDFELNRFLVRSVYLTIAGILLIYLSIHQEQHRHELWRLSTWPRIVDDDLAALMFGLLQHAAVTLRAERGALVWSKADEEEFHLSWFHGEAFNSVRWVGPSVSPELDEFDFYCRGIDGTPIVVTASGDDIRVPVSPLDPKLHARFGSGGVLSVRVKGTRIHGRLFIFDASEMTSDDMVLCRIVADTMVARLDEYVLLHELRDSAVVNERIRVSRELHDGILQSLTGIALQLRVAERVLAAEPERAIGILGQVRDLIVQNQRELRDFVRSLRDQENVSEDPPLSLRLMAIAERARVEWSMKVTIEITEDATIPPEIARQITPLVNEAISNAGRHGGADLVQVRLVTGPGRLTLKITDNGRGFPFQGRYDLNDLAKRNSGPLTLRERITELGGSLDLESTDQGATLEILIPFHESFETPRGRPE